MRIVQLALIGAILAAVSPAAAAPEQRSNLTVPGRPGIEVDVQLVLAVDVSLSMDNEEQRLQRDAYVASFRDDLVHAAIATGPNARIAVTYVEWSGEDEQRVLVPWTLIDGAPAARAFADRLAAAPISRMRRTSISNALLFAARLFDQSDYVARRRVIDISGDGSNNEGMPLTAAREQVLAQDVVINGLPLVFDRVGTQSFGDTVVTLESYYEQCVIGGAGAFLVPVHQPHEFRDALKTKLILEIAGLHAPLGQTVLPASDTEPTIRCNGRYSF